ncbi:MAG: transcriptional regulator [Bacteroidetes bacterium CG2_30_32_10]|nr:MAG: transcriptional regulator [Bacteroidetes bacterium CG2_30_32_10]
MSNNFQIDSMDKKILEILTKNARKPYLDIARSCKVSGAAIHQRVERLMNAEIISGSQFNLSHKGMGYSTCAFIGIQVNLLTTKSHEEVYRKITQIPEIVECHHISGKYSLLIKIYTKDNEHLKNIIIEKIQSIQEIVSTETFISLQEGFIRQIPIIN